MDPQTQNSPVTNKQLPFVKLLLLSLIIVFAVLLFVLYNSQRQKSMEESTKVATSQVPSIAPTIFPTEGNFLLNAVETTSSVNTPVTITLAADSNGKSIVGYDLVFQYDPSSLEIMSVTSALPDFTVYPLQSTDHYSLTATKKITSKDPSVFSETEILQLVVTPKKTGNHTLQLISTLGNEKTQMVDETTKVIYPAVSEITLEVK